MSHLGPGPMAPSISTGIEPGRPAWMTYSSTGTPLTRKSPPAPVCAWTGVYRRSTLASSSGALVPLCRTTPEKSTEGFGTSVRFTFLVSPSPTVTDACAGW